MQCGQLAFVCIYIYVCIYVCIYIYMYVYIYVCIYIHHTLIAWVRFLWSRPQTTRHVVRDLGDDRRVKRSCETKLNGPAATWYWSDQEAIDV